VGFRPVDRQGFGRRASALLAFGGRLADIAGHRRMVVIGVIVFAVASALCGATPTGSAAEAWIITFRISQGAESACENIARHAGSGAAKLFSTVPHDFALASRMVFYGMAAVMAVAFLVALVAMPGGKSRNRCLSRALKLRPAPPDAGTLAR
jgi:MFS family permease